MIPVKIKGVLIIEDSTDDDLIRVSFKNEEGKEVLATYIPTKSIKEMVGKDSHLFFAFNTVWDVLKQLLNKKPKALKKRKLKKLKKKVGKHDCK